MKVAMIIPAGTADVYNMEVDQTHDFAVNGGAIVHNCRYVCMANPIAARPPKVEKIKPYNPLDDDPKPVEYGNYEWYRRY